MLKTFTWCPEVGAEAQYLERNLKAQFGDGYVQIMGDGINTSVDVWPLTFSKDIAEALLIRKFILEHKERTPFYWTPPYETEAAKYIASGLTFNYSGGRLGIVKATFTKTFRLIG